MGSSASARSAATASGTSPHFASVWAMAAMAQASLREASGFLDKLTSFGFAGESLRPDLPMVPNCAV